MTCTYIEHTIYHGHSDASWFAICAPTAEDAVAAFRRVHPDAVIRRIKTEVVTYEA